MSLVLKVLHLQHLKVKISSPEQKRFTEGAKIMDTGLMTLAWHSFVSDSDLIQGVKYVRQRHKGEPIT